MSILIGLAPELIFNAVWPSAGSFSGRGQGRQQESETRQALGEVG